MATPTESQTNADAIAAQEALVAAANQRFIDDLDVQMAQAVAQGKFRTSALMTKNVSAKDIADHYQGLGYQVLKPGCQPYYWQPVDLFGETWVQYWEGRLFCDCPKPCRIRVSWR